MGIVKVEDHCVMTGHMELNTVMVTFVICVSDVTLHFSGGKL